MWFWLLFVPAVFWVLSLLSDSGSSTCYKGSRTFFFASLFYPPSVRRRIFALYAYARRSDDLVDEYTGQEQKEHVEWLQRSVERMVDPSLPLDDMKGTLELVDKFGTVVREHHIPKWCVRLLIDGYEHDNVTTTIDDERALIDYGICVASSIGLICTHIFSKVVPRSTQIRAAALGVAFQLTNIARDLQTDADLGRTYVPQTWGELDPLVAAKRLVFMSETYYTVAWDGLQELPWCVRPAVACAWFIYREIGLQIADADRYPRRSFVNHNRKVALATRAIWHLVSGTAPQTRSQNDDNVIRLIDELLKRRMT